MAVWTATHGTNVWSDPNNWQFGILPGWGDTVQFNAGAAYTSVIDSAYTQDAGIPTIGTLQLVGGVTLDIQRSISMDTIIGGSTGTPQTGTSGRDGLITIGNGATLTYNDPSNNPNIGGGGTSQSLYIASDGVGAQGTVDFLSGIGPSATITLNGVNFDSPVGIADNVGSAILTLENGARWTASSQEFYNEGTVVETNSAFVNLSALNNTDESVFAGEFPGSLHDTGASTDQQVILSGSNNELVLPNTSDGLAMTITFGPTDKIEVAGINEKSVTFTDGDLNLWSGSNGTGELLAVLNHVTLSTGDTNLDASQFTIGTDATGTFVDFASCFVKGTRILTDKGEVNVEMIQEGDSVLTTMNGVANPCRVIWVGHRVIDLNIHPYPWMVAPIRISEGAFGHNTPHRDLILSPDHSVFIDGGLVPLKLLVNDMSIVPEPTQPSVEYYHIETERHAIILAEGLTVETYLDTGNRGDFDETTHPLFLTNAVAKSWETDACAALILDSAMVKPIWHRVAQRAATLGFERHGMIQMIDEPDILLQLANGQKIRPIKASSVYTFAVPHEMSAVLLVSRRARPNLVRPWIDDQRLLGVAIRQISLSGTKNQHKVIRSDDPLLKQGWWTPERQADGAHWRWSNGAGVIPLSFETTTIEIDIAMTAQYAPDLAEAA